MKRYFEKLIDLFLNKHFAKFLIVGGLSTIINFGIFLILYRLMNVNYAVSYASGYLGGVAFGFAFNKLWTFESTSNQHAKEAGKYLFVYTINLFLGLGVMKLLVEFSSMNPIIANILTIGITTVLNFLGTKLLVFRK